MKKSDWWALFYSVLALIMFIWGYNTRIEMFLYTAILLALISFCWMFREQIIKKFRRK
jgi:4-hydroxybenzoate polyprenyltransferase